MVMIIIVSKDKHGFQYALNERVTWQPENKELKLVSEAIATSLRARARPEA